MTKKRYGLIGHPLGHTLSPFIHKQIMKDCGIDGTYRAIDLAPADFGQMIGGLLADMDGFNVTIPYKQAIIPYLSRMDETARRFGAVNTVAEGYGGNTDSYGFRKCGIPIFQKRILLIGAGGVARVMLHEAFQAGAKDVTVCSRRPEQAQALLREAQGILGFSDQKGRFCSMEQLTPEYDVILNATPVGMWPHCDGIPIPKAIVYGAEYVFDSIYNPLATKLVLAARSAGIPAQNGLAMLYHQAVEAQRIWNPGADLASISFLLQRHKLKQLLLRSFPVKFVLTGFMGCGKTTVGKALAKLLHVGFVDLDLWIVEEKRKPIFEIFRSEGEAVFREIEQKCLLRAMEEPKTLVVATGGGALADPANVAIVRKHQGYILLLSADLETIHSRIGETGSRPLLHDRTNDSIRCLYESRIPIYNAAADGVVETHGGIGEVALRLRTLLEEDKQ